MASDDYDSNHTQGEIIPQWKRELILRRRTLGRAITSTGALVQPAVTCPTALRGESHLTGNIQQQRCNTQQRSTSCDQLDFHPECSVGNMRLLDADLGSELVVNGIKCSRRSDCATPHIMVEEKPVKKPSFRNMERHKEDRHIKVLSSSKGLKNEDDYNSDSSEELQYGPGIVNKLKTKYLSMTLRENQKRHSRPSLLNLRRATSLENMLDEDSSKTQTKTQFIKKSIFLENQKPKLSHHHAKYLGLSRGSESIKRARSMDTLIKNEPKCVSTLSKRLAYECGLANGNVAPSIINENLVIVDNVSKDEKCKHSVCVENQELPPPDLVKQTLKIFEPSAVKKGKDQLKPKPPKPTVNKPPVLAKIQIEKHKCSTTKPVLSPKPILTPEKRLVRPKILQKHFVPIASSTPPVVKPLTVNVEQERPMISTQTSFSPTTVSPISINNSNHVESYSDGDEHTVKYISQLALENISKEGVTVKYSFNDSVTISSNKSHLPKQDLAQATNAALISSQSLERPAVSTPDTPVSPVKQVAVIRPVITNKMQTQGLTDQEIEKNHINRVKSIEPIRVISMKNDVEANDKKNVCEVKNEKSQLWEKKPWQSQNSIVFNFSDRKSIPDYIENDGLILASRKGRFNGNEDDVDLALLEDDLEPASPCNIRFIGDNILINGKSNLRKEPRQKKLRIQFNDEATTLFEYPSEESLNKELTGTANPSNLTLGGGSLSNYTPSKLGGAAGFELGVTRVASSPISSPPAPPPAPAQHYLKPVDSKEVTPWSQETASDILF